MKIRKEKRKKEKDRWSYFSIQAACSSLVNWANRSLQLAPVAQTGLSLSRGLIGFQSLCAEITHRFARASDGCEISSIYALHSRGAPASHDLKQLGPQHCCEYCCSFLFVYMSCVSGPKVPLFRFSPCSYDSGYVMVDDPFVTRI